MFNLFQKTINTFFKESGFSLLEVMMATVVVGIGLVGAASLIVQNIQAQYINKNILIASQLAQEGLELVRNVRDGNWLDLYVLPDTGWKYGRSVGGAADIVQDGDYAIDYDVYGTNGIIAGVDNINDARLSINAEGYYTHGIGQLTPFYRLISVDEDASGDFITVTCKVRSVERERHNDYEAKTVLYKWR